MRDLIRNVANIGAVGSLIGGGLIGGEMTESIACGSYPWASHMPLVAVIGGLLAAYCFNRAKELLTA